MKWEKTHLKGISTMLVEMLYSQQPKGPWFTRQVFVYRNSTWQAVTLNDFWAPVTKGLTTRSCSSWNLHSLDTPSGMLLLGTQLPYCEKLKPPWKARYRSLVPAELNLRAIPAPVLDTWVKELSMTPVPSHEVTYALVSFKTLRKRDKLSPLCLAWKARESVNLIQLLF